MEIKRRIIVILGPTSSGKSELAVKFAKKFNGEIISADSRQVYQYLDLATGKIEGRWQNLALLQNKKVQKTQNTKHKAQTKPKFQSTNSKQKAKKVFVYKNIVHHCIDFVSPKKIFTAEDFKKCAEYAIEDITSRGKTPIIVGGTAFYIYALTGDIQIPQIPPDWKLRVKLEKKSTETLFKILKKLDPKRAGNIDPHNRRRLIRAIEIAEFGAPISKLPKKKSKYNILWLGIKLPNEELKKRIKRRLEKRFKQGMVAEIKKVHYKYGVSWKRLEEMGLEMKYISQYLRGFFSKKELVEILNKKSWQFAKRQLTWWKKDKRIKWAKDQEDAENAIKNFGTKFSLNYRLTNCLYQ